MGIGIGNLGNIVKDFSESVNQIFGGSNNPNSRKGHGGRADGFQLFDPALQGTSSFFSERWTGNAVKPASVKYGFAIVTLDEIKAHSFLDDDIYELDIPPQSITQKEIFATNISATRKGVIVESEGVVFKDIIIQGTTGVFPGIRGGSNTPKANFSDFTKPPSPPSGVDLEKGTSKASGVKTISGYEEFIRLRQFFLRYAAEKVKTDGNRFLVFINGKDNQSLIVEPLEFTMERNSKSPMTYNYRIVLKSIGNFELVFNRSSDSEALSLFEQIGNISGNVSAALSQARAVINQSRRLVERVSQSIDQTFIGPMRQLQFAAEDLRDGLSTILSLPEILSRNATETIMNIRENIAGINQSVNDFTAGITTTGSGVEATTAQTFNQARSVATAIATDNRIPVPRSAVEDLRDKMRFLSDNIADFVNLGSDSYNTINDRVVTNIPGELKVASDDEVILLGTLETTIIALNQALATNNMFQADIEESVNQVAESFQGLVDVRAPKSVKEITIQRGETLERIALNELGSASRWVDIVVLNGLKAPYISDEGGDHVKKPGEKLLIGVN